MNDEPSAGGCDRLEVRIAEKTFPGAVGGPVAVLRDCAFTLPKGQVGALVGRSGGGKTTILRLIAGLDPDFSGDIRRPGRGALGVVFQEPRLLPWRTVEENVRLAVEAAGLPGGGDDALYALLGLAGHRDRYPGELSLGLARRAAIARAFAVEPDLLLLDEPFVSLDEATALRVRGELVALQERSRPTTILVTHDLDEALALADHVFGLAGSPGRIAATLAVPAPRGAREPGLLAELKLRWRAMMPAG